MENGGMCTDALALSVRPSFLNTIKTFLTTYWKIKKKEYKRS